VRFSPAVFGVRGGRGKKLAGKKRGGLRQPKPAKKGEKKEFEWG